MKFYGFIVVSTPNNMILSGFPEKSMKLENYYLIYCPSSKHWQISFKWDIYLENISSPFFHFQQTLKVKGSSHKKDIILYFLKKWLQLCWSNFVNL